MVSEPIDPDAFGGRPTRLRREQEARIRVKAEGSCKPDSTATERGLLQ